MIQQCGTQTIQIEGSLVQAHSLPLMYAHGYDIACLTSDSGDFCMLERQDWQGQEAISYDADYCSYPDASSNMPECADPDFDLQTITSANTSMSSVYPLDLVSLHYLYKPVIFLIIFFQSFAVTVSSNRFINTWNRLFFR